MANHQLSSCSTPYWNKRFELTSSDGCLLWGNRVVVPKAGLAEMLQELHEVDFAGPFLNRMFLIVQRQPNLLCIYEKAPNLVHM